MKADIKEYARRGAQARAIELNAELQEIYNLFPDILVEQTPAAAPAEMRAAAHDAPVKRRRRRPPMTDSQKKAVSTRMKMYWAMRKANEK